VPKRVEEWEETGKIKADWAQRLADKTHAPYGYLFLPTPPEEKLDIPDFRTVDDRGVHGPSVELIDTLDLAILRQDWYRDHLIREGFDALPFVGSIVQTMPVVAAAAHIRATLHLGTELRSTARNWEEALRTMIARVEEHDILVMRSGVVGNNTSRPLSKDEFRGFALADEYAPIIFINATDFLGAQMFTLMHEVVHVFLKASGVSNLRDTYASDHRIEQFCNKVAAEALVPEDELRHAWLAYKHQIDPLVGLTRYFKVSNMVMLRRLRDLDLINVKEFDQRVAQLKARYEALKNKKKDEKKSGGDFYATQGSRASKRFVRALVASTLVGETPYREAFKLLGFKSMTAFDGLAQELKLR
ncbi:MAG: ImmA/IrrE family metallo-endopeptidase, partial [Flavobacteriales bacterium]|nr:ImmA/IrrE family metallo-endopeptidase [Flavobacteriales bacterium]